MPIKSSLFKSGEPIGKVGNGKVENNKQSLLFKSGEAIGKVSDYHKIQQIPEDIAGKINHRFTPDFSKTNVAKTIVETKKPDLITTIPSKTYDESYVKELQLKNNMNAAKREYEETKANDDRNILVKFLQMGSDLSPVHYTKTRYDKAKKDYEDFKSTKYYSSLPNGDVKSTNPENKQYGLTFDDSIDWKYEYINDINGMRGIINSLAARGSGGREYNIYRNINDREIGIYNYLYQNEGKEKAEKFLDFIETDLDARLNEEVAQSNKKFAEKAPILSTVISPIGTMASAGEQLINYGEYLATGKMKTNKSATAVSSIRNTISDKVDLEIGNWDAFDFVYNTVMSGVDSAVVAPFGAAGAVALGLSAAGSTTNDILARGGDSSQAFWGGAAAGVFEGFFEKFSIGQLNAMKESAVTGFKDYALNLVKSMGVNFSEEAATEAANILYDYAINGGISNYSIMVQEFIDNGDSPEIAKKKAAQKLGLQVLEAGASGALMGFGFASISSAASYKNASSIGKIIAANESESEVLNVALSMNGNTESYKMASEIKNSGEITTAKMGGLVSQIMSHISNQKSVAIETAISERAKELGIDSKTKQKLTSYLIKAATNGKIETIEADAIGKNAKAQQIITEIKNSEAWAEDLNTQLSSIEKTEHTLQNAITFDTQGNKSDFNNVLTEMDASADADLQSTTNAVSQPLETYNNEKQNLIKSFLNSADEKIKSFVERVKSGDLTFKREKISNVNQRTVEDIKNLLGIDTTGYTHNINTNGIQHILNRHGENGEHDSTMSLDDDIARVGWVLENYDSVEILEKDNEIAYSTEFNDKENNPAPQIKFIKKIDGSYYVVEAACENNYNKMWVQSAYLTKNKEDVTQAASADNDQDTHARSALPSPSSNNNISQGDNVVNTNISTNSQNNSENNTSESGEFGLSEPTDQEIYREPTDEEKREAMFGKRKNAKQRHILDVAKKFDSGMKVVFVSENAEVLSGQKGVYMRESNTMYLSEGNSAVESYYQVFKHEFIHRLESKGAYQSFKNYLFRNSSSFERYARAQLGENFKGNREEALQALAQRYIDTVQKGKFPKSFKDGFTVEDAQYEMVADFISEVLFKGNRADVAQNLADGNLEAIFSIEDTLSEFESLSETDRTWFQKIIDAIRDFIASLKGVKQNERLVEDLEYIEKRLARVLDSKDTKKAASRAGNKQFSLKIIHTDGFVEELSDARSLTDEQAVDYLNKAKKGELQGHSYIPIRKDTPQVIIDTLKGAGERVENRSLVMQVRKAQQAMSSNNKGVKSNKHGSNVRKHALSPNEIIEIINNLDKPNTIILQTNRKGKDGKSLPDNVAVFVECSNKDNEGVAVVEFDSYIDSEFIGTEFGDTNYHTVVTIFEPDVEREGEPFDYAEELLENPNNFELEIEKRQSTGSATREKHPNTSSELPSIDSVPQEKDTVNSNSMQETEDYSENLPEGKRSFSLGSPAQQMRDNLKKYESGEITREEYLEETDRLWGKANETFGAFETGENAKAPIATPTAVAEDKPTERFTRTIIETGKLTEEMLQGMEEKVLLGDFSYEVISDEKALEKANIAINNGTAEDIWEETLNGSKITKNQMAIGERLLKDAMESGNTKRVLELSAELADIFTRAGQTVQAARLLKKMTGAGRLVSLQRTVKTLNGDLRQKYGEDMPPIKISPETAKRLAEAKTKDGIEYAYEEAMYEVAQQMPVTFLDKFNAWRYFAMLSNPKTHIRNIVGNALFVSAVRIKSFIAAVGEQGLDQSKRTKSLIIKKEYRDFAKKDAKRKDVINLLKGNKYNDKSTLREKQRIFKSNVLEFLTRFNSNALEAEDMLFKNKHYIHALAGFLQARKVDLANASQEILDEARIYAVKEAKKATFNDESALANWVQNFGNKNLGTSIAVEGTLPFKRTPINVVKRGVEYSPIGLTTTLTKGLYDVKKGKITVTEFIDGLASGLTGTGIMLAGMFLANLGCITGGEDDDEKSQFEKWLGKQEYAVEIFGKSYTVDWAAPANIPFFVGVEIVNTLNEGEEFSLSQLSNAVWNSLEPITNLSMLSGMQGVIESARYADSAQTLSAIAVDALTSYGMQVVPSLSGAVARTIDPTQRSWYTDKNDKWLDSTAQTVKNNIQSKVPGLSYTQIPKIDMWGREVSRGGTAERVLENFASPGYYSKIEVTETSEELKRIFNETDQDVFPNIAAKSFKVGSETKHLTAREYVTYAKAKGSYSYEYIKEFMEATAYKKLTDKEKADVITKLYEYANAKAKAIVSDYDLMKNYKTVTQWEQNGRSAIDYYIFRAINK